MKNVKTRMLAILRKVSVKEKIEFDSHKKNINRLINNTLQYA